MIRHGKVDLALHELQSSNGPTLVLLHGLGERSRADEPAAASSWPGSVLALDFTGHGASTIPGGGGYTAEQLMGDVDGVLAHVGPATLFGRGLGAYVALLTAGARPTQVRGAVLADGPGLAGGGPAPGSAYVVRTEASAADRPPDPLALIELAHDLRPPDYATTFARLAIQLSGLLEPITVCAVGRPAWLEAVVAEPGVRVSSMAAALAPYASA